MKYALLPSIFREGKTPLIIRGVRKNSLVCNFFLISFFLKRAIKECHSFFSKGAMWEWHSFFKGGSAIMSSPLYPSFFLKFFPFFVPSIFYCARWAEDEQAMLSRDFLIILLIIFCVKLATCTLYSPALGLLISS